MQEVRFLQQQAVFKRNNACDLTTRQVQQPASAVQGCILRHLIQKTRRHGRASIDGNDGEVFERAEACKSVPLPRNMRNCYPQHCFLQLL